MNLPITYFKGRLLLSFKGVSMIVLICLTGFLFYTLSEDGHVPVIISVPCHLLIAGAILLCYKWQMYYFGLSEKQLFIRNTIFFWQRKAIELSDIKSIRIDNTSFDLLFGYYGPYYLCVYYTNTKKQKFYAASLRGAKWAQLTAELEKYAITVVNRYPYIPFKEML